MDSLAKSLGPQPGLQAVDTAVVDVGPALGDDSPGFAFALGQGRLRIVRR